MRVYLRQGRKGMSCCTSDVMQCGIVYAPPHTPEGPEGIPRVDIYKHFWGDVIEQDVRERH